MAEGIPKKKRKTYEIFRKCPHNLFKFQSGFTDAAEGGFEE